MFLNPSDPIRPLCSGQPILGRDVMEENHALDVHPALKYDPRLVDIHIKER
jgi:hypothetical protein